MYSSCVSIYSVEIHNKEYMQKMIKLSMSCNNSEKNMKLEAKVMRKNISCHPVSKIPGELTRNEAVPSHMEYDLTQFCLQPIEILEPLSY